MHAFLPHDTHAILQPVDAVGNFRKVVSTQFLLASVVRTVVRAGRLEMLSGSLSADQTCRLPHRVRSTHSDSIFIKIVFVSSLGRKGGDIT